MRLVPRALRYKVPFVVLFIFIVVLSVVMRGTAWIVEASLSDAERTAISGDVATAGTALMSQTQWLGRTVADWAHWTDTYDYIGGRRASYPDENLNTDVLVSLGVDFMAFCLPSGEVVGLFEKGSDPGRLTPLPSEVGDSLVRAVSALKPQGADDVSGGIVLLGDRPTLFASSRVTDNQRTSDSNGYLVIGSYIDQEDEEYVRRVTGFDAKINSPAIAREAVNGGSVPVTVHYPDSTKVAATTTLLTVDGAPAVDVTVTKGRVSREQTLRALSLAGWGMLGGILVFSVVTYIALSRTVLSRLAQLHRYVVGSRDGTVTATKQVGGSDEITDLASALDQASERVRQTEELLHHEASHDYLTGLPNRRRLMRDLEKALSEAQRHGTSLALLVLDIDDFKSINDELGHAQGDETLCWFAALITSTVREYCTVARLGGDEFVILLPYADHDDAARVVQRIHELLESTEPPYGQARDSRVAASIGIAVYPDDAMTADHLIRHADSGMYAAKTGPVRNPGEAP